MLEKVKLFILISTINERIINLRNILQEYNENIIYIVSHQVTIEIEKDILNFIDNLIKRQDVKYNIMEGEGVAKNRNNTLNFIEPSSLCLILDDDVLLCKDIFTLVRESFDENLSADFISFKILDLEGNEYKSYPKEKQWHTLRTLTGVGTTEMAFKSDFILDNNIKFDERFGPGADQYPLGEDFIFAMDLYYLKTKMLFMPIPIVKHPIGSTGGSLDKNVIFARGAMFARVFGLKAYFVNLFFTIKHKKMYQNSYTMFQYLKLMFLGSYDFLKQEKIK